MLTENNGIMLIFIPKRSEENHERRKVRIFGPDPDSGQLGVNLQIRLIGRAMVRPMNLIALLVIFMRFSVCFRA
jgi:hypothetical protein